MFLSYLFTYLSYHYRLLHVIFFSSTIYHFIFIFFPFLLPNSSKFPRQERHLESKRRSNTERKIHLKQSRDVDRSPSCRCGDKPNGPGILKVSLHWHTLHFLPQRSVHGRWGFFSFLGSSYFLERIFFFFGEIDLIGVFKVLVRVFCIGSGK